MKSKKRGRISSESLSVILFVGFLIVLIALQNNEFSITGLTASSKPDLIIESVTPSNNNPDVGGWTTIHYRIKNIGNTDVVVPSNSLIEAGMYVNKPDGTTQYLKGPYVRTVIEPDDSQGYAINVDFPIEGLYKIKTVVDKNNNLDESNENNNEMIKHIAVGELKPDLVIDSVTWDPLHPNQREDVTFNVKVRNIGLGPVTPTLGNMDTSLTTMLYEKIGNQYQTRMGQFTFDTINPGESHMFEITFVDFFDGNRIYNLKLITDYDDTYEESKENNNWMYFDIPVGYMDSNKPDLVIDSVTWDPQIPEPGEYTTFKIKLRNIGDATLSASANNPVTVNIEAVSSDFEDVINIGQDTHGSVSIPFLGTYTMEFENFRFNKASTYTVSFVVDLTNKHPEVNENNNAGKLYIPVQERPGPSCTDECSSGATKCSSGFTHYKQTCGNYDDDSCLEWPVAISDREYCEHGCENGECKPEPECVDLCELGETRCNGDNQETCGNYDDLPCLEWAVYASDRITCEYGCSNNVCNEAPPCENDCSSGQKRCHGYYVDLCESYDDDSCLEWPSSVSDRKFCRYGCTGGECKPEPVDKPDLTVGSISWEPSNPYKGGTVHFKVEIKNIGTEPAEATSRDPIKNKVCWYRSNDLNTPLTCKYPSVMQDLDAGESYTADLYQSFGLADTYKMTVKLDRTSKYRELDETNNLEETYVDVYEGAEYQPDLIIESVTGLPSSMETGWTNRPKVTIKNIGGAQFDSSKALIVSMCVYHSATPDTAAGCVMNFEYLTIDPSDTNIVTMKNGLNLGWVDNYKIRFKLTDSDHLEANEDNNEKILYVDVYEPEPELVVEEEPEIQGPDLMVEAIRPGEVEVGEYELYTYDIKNIGNAAITCSPLEIKICMYDPSVTTYEPTQDNCITEYRYGTREPGQYYSAHLDRGVKFDTVGKARFEVTADPRNTYSEASKDNNYAVFWVDVKAEDSDINAASHAEKEGAEEEEETGTGSRGSEAEETPPEEKREPKKRKPKTIEEEKAPEPVKEIEKVPTKYEPKKTIKKKLTFTGRFIQWITGYLFK